MSYVDAFHDQKTEKIMVAERIDGKRIYVDYPAEYTFYYEDRAGKHKSIFGDSLEKVTCSSSRNFLKELQRCNNKKIFEKDIKPISRCLEQKYSGAAAPKLNVCYIDIETDFCKTRGYAPTSDPFNRITAITVYLSWLEQLVTVAMPPDGMNIGEAEKLCEGIDNVFLFTDERAMLDTMLSLIDDADILSGWNSETYDLPYIVNRITKVMAKSDTRRLCLWGQFPKKRNFERFGTEQETYDLVGRVHLDYMQLYIKYNYEERHSYALDAIGEYELNERKTAYQGTLDQLYNDDFRKFIIYNRQDVALIDKLDKKLKFLDLANQIAHDSTVLLPATMGAVAVTDQAIINEAHSKGLCVPSRNRVYKNFDDPTEEAEEELKAAGAYVAYPKKGLHNWIGSVDINSLYPSVFRALNMSPETIVGQIRLDLTEKYLHEKMHPPGVKRKISSTEAWEGLFSTLEYSLVMERDREIKLTVEWQSGETIEVTGAEIYKFVFAPGSDLVLSANGTLFTLSKTGIIPGLLEKWLKQRKQLQFQLKCTKELQVGVTLSDDFLANLNSQLASMEDQ
jgi:DNA polymerase elongation subunit (family B)